MTAPNTAPAATAADQGVGTRLPFNQEEFLKDIDQRVARLIAKHKGDPEEAIALVMSENKKYRDQNDALNRQVAELRERQPGKEDLVLKTPEERALFKAIQDLVADKTITKPEDLAKLIKEHGELKAKDAKRADEDLAKELAGEEWDDIGLKEFLELKQMTGEVKTINIRDPKDPKKTVQEKIPHVRPKNDDKSAAQPLKEWLEATASKTVLALLRKDGKGADTTDTRDGRRRVASFPDQSSVSTSKTGKAGSASSSPEAVGNYLSNTFSLPDHLPKKE